MNAKIIEQALIALIEQHGDDFTLLLEEAGADAATIERVRSYADGGYLTADAGFVLDMGGAADQFQVTIREG